jgi:hypothetical protein
MNVQNLSQSHILETLRPETDLERQLILHDTLRLGLGYGEPRYGHPEGKVLYHIPEIFENIERLSPPLSIQDRACLRLITLLHDSFKYIEDKHEPRDWSRHHGILARQFAENFISDAVILDIIELHDEAYYCWRLEVLEDEPEQAAARFKFLLSRIGYCLQLYYVFFKCDTRTGDKTQAPVKWFEKKNLPIVKVHFLNLDAHKIF